MKDQTCFVQLGRYGDLLNILPLVKHISLKEVNRPVVMVQNDYVNLFDGIGYADVERWPMLSTDLLPAIEHAKNHYTRVVVPKVTGKDYKIDKFCDSFCVESWRLAGYLHLFGKLPLLIDKRDSERESLLCRHIIRSDLPLVLYNFYGVSSPYRHAQDLEKALIERFSKKFQLVNMNRFLAFRIYDLLALMDRASCLITTDTSTLHLSRASSVQVIALISDKPELWNGSRPHEGVVWNSRYYSSQFLFDDILNTVELCVQGRLKPKKLSDSKLIHLYSWFKAREQNTHRRHALAEHSWKREYISGNWVNVPVQDWQLPRLFDDGRRKLPYVKDLIDYAATHARDHDVLVYTNIDVGFVPGIGKRIMECMETSDACFSFRRDFPSLATTPDTRQIVLGQIYPGCDLFAFKASWWKENRSKFPDMVIGSEAWDWCLRALIKQSQNGNTVAFNDLIWHERHSSIWESPGNKQNLSSNQHNRSLAKPFLIAAGEYKGEWE